MRSCPERGIALMGSGLQWGVVSEGSRLRGE